MKYIQPAGSSSYGYPNHNVPPSEKGMEWCMSYAKAAYYDFNYVYPKGVFANNGGDYDKFRMYALGKQPNSPYKKWLGVDQLTNNTWMSIDWSIRPIISTYRDRAISRLMREENAIVATPIDMLAKSELDEYYAEIRAKLAVRELIKQTNQQFAQHPMIKLESGEPMDVEELEMRIEMGEQFDRSKDAEMAIELGLYENYYTVFRRGLYEDLFDYGVAGYKEWLGSDNKAKFRKVDPQAVITNFIRKGDFSDMIHAGELIDVSLIDLATVTDKDGNLVFNEEELQEFAGSIAGKFGNPAFLGSKTNWYKPYDKFKCKVLDIEFFTYNETTYTDRKDSNGNPVFREEEYGRGNKNNPRYKRKKYQYVYKCKWIVGTDKCYDWGMCYDQKRSVSIERKAQTSLSYKFFAYNFYEMKAQGFMERLIPYLDDYQLTTYKIQNFKNRAVPSGWWIDLDALENVALNKGGQNMEAKELLQMFFETGVLVGRSKDAAGNPQSPNWKPVIPVENTAASELQMFYQDLIATIQQIERMTGYNEITSGQPNPKTLVPGYEMANMSTNDALYPLAFSERYLTERLSEDVLCRMQQGVRKGEISGYAPYNGALGKNTLMFIKISPSIALRDYGIMLQEKPTEQEKIWLLQQMQADIQNGFLDASDAVTLVNTHNIKQAQQIWAYKVKKNKEVMQQNEMAKIQANNEGAAQAAQVAAQLDQQKLMLQGQMDIEKEKLRIQGELAKEKMRLEAEFQMKQLELGVKDKINMDLSNAKVEASEITARAKIASSAIDHETKIAATEIAGEKAKEKQHISNQKPKDKKEKK